jgi:MarR family transcriptional regulator, transcriptional regulator for hemolysin
MISKHKASELLDLFSTLQRARGWTDKKMFASLDLSPAKARLLEYIASHDGTSQTELAKATDTDKALTGRSVDAFVESGWVLRDRSKQDGRAYILSLSPSGRRVVRQFGSVRSEILERVTKSLNSEDVEDFRRIVNKLLASMQEKDAL